MPEAPVLALIAHDGKKADLISFAHKHADLLRQFQLVATGTTGQMLIDELDLDVVRYHSGPLGGDVQIASRIVEGNVYAVVFFIDPLGKHPHEPDIQTLLRACNVHNVPIATNESTARLIVERRAVQDSLPNRDSDDAS
ncbi:methylglyoxal synthase [Longibacter salinarum]|uniref:Methylglyoxal synthase n=1 Tax=Longibacter salinarum TaxID=1850348 RepID=A0A2A8CY61_9BACT|nr:methylglyoxal synthase [Longibacter salinarum]PEN13517.1 methylglyoxal synthase [Longibacter salinarum]